MTGLIVTVLLTVVGLAVIVGMSQITKEDEFMNVTVIRESRKEQD